MCQFLCQLPSRLLLPQLHPAGNDPSRQSGFEQISKPIWTTEIDEANTLEMLNAMLEQEFIGAVPEWDQLYWDGT